MAKKVLSLLVDKRHEDDAWGLVAVQDLFTGVLIPGKNPKMSIHRNHDQTDFSRPDRHGYQIYCPASAPG